MPKTFAPGDTVRFTRALPRSKNAGTWRVTGPCPCLTCLRRPSGLLSLTDAAGSGRIRPHTAPTSLRPAH